MPTVGVYQDSLEAALGKITEKEFDELCFEFGLELDDVTSDYEIAKRERGEEAAKGESQRVIFKIDVPANRYDLLCIEGLVRSLKIFKGLAPPPVYKLVPEKPNVTLTVSASVAAVRPFCVAAILRGVSFDQDRYTSFIDLQDKLHQNIGRQRTLVSIGTHDLSTVKAPFSYEALPPKDIRFIPLGKDKEVDGHGMMDMLADHLQLKAYLPIIRDKPVYPVIYDSNRVVCSVPPIINGEHSKITLATRDVFIEITANDLTKAGITLNTVVSMFAEHCDTPFQVEPVEVVYAEDYPANTFIKGGDKKVYPAMAPRQMEADVNRMKTALGLDDLPASEIVALLNKMTVPCTIDKNDSSKVNCEVPVTRSDIMHECDLVEDIAIAYGYNNLKTAIPEGTGKAAEQPVNHLSDLLRQELAMAGFTECMNWALLSRRENFKMMRREENSADTKRLSENPLEYSPSHCAAAVSDPKTAGFEILRTSVIPCLLKTLGHSKHLPPPIKFFEVGDVVVQDPTKETFTRNVRRVAAIIAHTKSQFPILHGVLDQIMYALNCEPVHEAAPGSKRRPFKLEPSDDPAFFPGQAANIICGGIKIGVIGDLHPEVVSSKGFDANFATSALELNVEPFLEWL